MATWQLQNAKTHFSAVVEKALTLGPQFISRHGETKVVLLSLETYNLLTGSGLSFTEHLLNFPKVDNLEYVLERDRTAHSDFSFDTK